MVWLVKQNRRPNTGSINQTEVFEYIHFKQSNIHIAMAFRISRMLLLFFAVSLFLARVESDYAPHLCPRLLSSTHLSPICCDHSPANHHGLLPSVESASLLNCCANLCQCRPGLASEFLVFPRASP